jgi:hypothetical protein
METAWIPPKMKGIVGLPVTQEEFSAIQEERKSTWRWLEGIGWTARKGARMVTHVHGRGARGALSITYYVVMSGKGKKRNVTLDAALCRGDRNREVWFRTLPETLKTVEAKRQKSCKTSS